jgi:hypothetical protein
MFTHFISPNERWSQVLWVIQINWIRWFFIVASVLLSGLVLARAIWPAVKDDRKGVSLLFWSGFDLRV